MVFVTVMDKVFCNFDCIHEICLGLDFKSILKWAEAVYPVKEYIEHQRQISSVLWAKSSDDVALAIQYRNKLRHVVLERCNIAEYTLCAPSVEILKLKNLILYSDIHLNAMKCLHSLHLENVLIGKHFLTHLPAQLRQLKLIHVNVESEMENCEFAVQLHSLESLCIVGNNTFTPETMTKMLNNLPTLSRLAIIDVSIDRQLLSVILSKSTLCELDMRSKFNFSGLFSTTPSSPHTANLPNLESLSVYIGPLDIKYYHLYNTFKDSPIKRLRIFPDIGASSPHLFKFVVETFKDIKYLCYDMQNLNICDYYFKFNGRQTEKVQLQNTSVLKLFVKHNTLRQSTALSIMKIFPNLKSIIMVGQINKETINTFKDSNIQISINVSSHHHNSEDGKCSCPFLVCNIQANR